MGSSGDSGRGAVKIERKGNMQGPCYQARAENKLVRLIEKLSGFQTGELLYI